MGLCGGKPVEKVGSRESTQELNKQKLGSDSKTQNGGYWSMDPEHLASQTHFTKNEVYALRELFDKVSNSVVRNGQITREEFCLALFKSHRQNIFSDRVFRVFDAKNTGMIDFAEFIRALSVFSNKAPTDEKARFAFLLYDIDRSGQLRPKEVKKFLLELFNENPDMVMQEHIIDQIVQNTFEEVDIDKSGTISLEEWLMLVQRKPAVISYMTLPVLSEITKEYPEFAFSRDKENTAQQQRA